MAVHGHCNCMLGVSRIRRRQDGGARFRVVRTGRGSRLTVADLTLSTRTDDLAFASEGKYGYSNFPPLHK